MFCLTALFRTNITQEPGILLIRCLFLKLTDAFTYTVKTIFSHAAFFSSIVTVMITFLYQFFVVFINCKVKIKKFTHFLEIISKERFLLENDVIGKKAEGVLM